MVLEGSALRELAAQAINIRDIPVRLPEGLRRSIGFALGSAAVGFTIGCAIGPPVATLLVPLNLVTAMMAGGVLIATSAFTRPVPEKVHRLAWLTSIPASINAALVGVAGIAGLAVAAVALAAGIVVLMILTGALAAALR